MRTVNQFLLFAMLLFTQILWSQTNFSHLHGDENSSFNTACNISLLDENSYLIVNNIRDFEIFDGNGIELIKYDLEGNIVWNKYYEVRTGAGYVGCFADLLKTSNGNYFVSSIYWDGFSDGPDYYFMKFDPEGELLWTNTAGNFNDIDVCLASAELSDGGFAFSGISKKFGDADVYVVRTDSSCNVVWEKYFDEGQFERSQSIFEDHDGGIVLGCFTAVSVPGGGDSDGFEESDGFLLKLDSLGNEVWRKEYATENKDDCDTYIVPIENKSYLVSGCIDQKQEWQGNPRNQYFISKLDSNQNEVWRTTFFGQKKKIHKIKSLESGNILVVGSNKATPSNPELWGWIAKLSSEGDILWDRTYYYYNQWDTDIYPVSNVTFDCYFADAIEGIDGGYLATGTYSITDTATHNDTHFAWMLKVDEMGCLEPECADSTLFVTVEDIDFLPASIPFKLYPNPTKGLIYLDYEIPPLSTSAKLKLYNQIGEEILNRELELGKSKELFDLNSFANGSYFYHILINNKKAKVGKFLLLR